MRLRHLSDPDSLPALDKSFAIERPALGLAPDAPPVRILLLYGSLRARSFSRLAVEEAARLLQFFGAETRIFDPSDLPLPDQVQSDDHPAVKELRALSEWSEGQVWCSPERHGQITSVMKAQIDHLPLEMAGIRPTHLDSHQHLHVVPGITGMVLDLARRFAIAAVRIPAEPLGFFGGMSPSVGRARRRSSSSLNRVPSTSRSWCSMPAASC